MVICRMAQTTGIFPGWTGYVPREKSGKVEGKILLAHLHEHLTSTVLEHLEQDPAQTWPHVWAWGIGVIKAMYSLKAKVPEKARLLFFLELSKMLEKQWPIPRVFQPSPPDCISMWKGHCTHISTSPDKTLKIKVTKDQGYLHYLMDDLHNSSCFSDILWLSYARAFTIIL